MIENEKLSIKKMIEREKLLIEEWKSMGQYFNNPNNELLDMVIGQTFVSCGKMLNDIINEYKEDRNGNK